MKMLSLSSKYQIVIPKEARQKLGIKSPNDSLYIRSISDTEIVIAKKKPNMDEILKLLESSPPTKHDVVTEVRKLRDEWDR